MTDKEKKELKDGVVSIFKRFNILDHTATIGGLRDDILRYINSLQEDPVSEDLEEVAKLYTLYDSINPWRNHTKEAFIAGAKWGMNQATVEIQAQSMALANGCPEENTSNGI